MHHDPSGPVRSKGLGSLSIGVIVVIALAAVAVAAASAMRSTHRLSVADRRGAEAYARIAQLSDVLDAAADAETGSRGYVITGDTTFLAPYHHGLAVASSELDSLEQLYASDAVRRPLLLNIRSVLRAQGEHMRRTVEVRRAEGFAAAAALVATGRGRTLTDSLHATIGHLVDDERAELARQRADIASATVTATRTLWTIGGGGVLLLAVAFIALLRESRRRRDAAALAAELNHTLATRIGEIRRELEQSESKLRHALDGLLEGCALIDYDLRYLYTNPSSARQGRTTVDQMIGRTLLEIYPGSEDSALVRAMRRTLEERVAQTVELEFVFPDGASGWFELHIEPVPEGLFALSSETTERVRAEREREAAAGRLRALLESLPDQVFVLDRDGILLELHRPAGSLPETPEEELLGRPVSAVIPAQAAEQVIAALRDVLLTGISRTLQYQSPSPAGTSHFEAVIVPTSDQRLTVVLRDITVRQNLEMQLRQAQKMEAVGQLSGGIAHDFNNVLTIIGSNAELLRLATSETPRSELQEILIATKRGASMIAQLMSFSRREVLSRECVAVPDVIHNFTRMLERLLPAYVRLELGALEARESVLIDPGALEQLIANLCTNARDAMPDGGVIRIDCNATWLDAGYHATHPWVKPGPYICVSVSDTGAGMDEATKLRIFEPFFTTKPVGVGTGLGLSMVYGIMKDHNGMVHVYSEVGKGTVVKLYFPVAEGMPEEPVEPARSNLRDIAGGGECILIAEDEPAIRLASRRALESKGYQVLDAGDGEHALALWHEHRERIALVISDLVMPNLGGIQLAAALREEGSTVPVIFTSGYSADAVYRDTKMPADVEFLHKPWTLAQLFARVRDVLDERRSAA